jgi:enoyl-CoA hydratase
MPETHIGLFPDVGGGWFLARTPGRLGEFLGLAGQVLGAADSLAVDWADVFVPAAALDELVQAIADGAAVDGVGALSAVNAFAGDVGPSALRGQRELIDRVFAAPDLAGIVAALGREEGEFAASVAQALAKRSPLMMAVTLEQIRRARTMSLADDLRMERGLVRHCFHLRSGAASETLEGIRALVVDKDHAPRWNPAAIDGVEPAMVEAFFASPWPAHAHPLRDLA